MAWGSDSFIAIGTGSSTGSVNGRLSQVCEDVVEGALRSYGQAPVIGRASRSVHERTGSTSREGRMDVRTDSAKTRAASHQTVRSHSSSCSGGRRLVEHQHLARQEEQRRLSGGAGESSWTKGIR